MSDTGGPTVQRRSLAVIGPDQFERRIRERLDAFGPDGLAELLRLGSRPTMTSSRFMWLVVAGRGHSSEQRGFTEDLDGAKAKVNEHAEQLRREGRTDWFGFVLDLDRPTVIAPPGSTQPVLGWERVFFVDGRD